MKVKPNDTVNKYKIMQNGKFLYKMCVIKMISCNNCTGELTSEDVLQWLIEQKTEDRIETVTRSMLDSLLVNVQYLAVYFCKLTIFTFVF